MLPLVASSGVPGRSDGEAAATLPSAHTFGLASAGQTAPPVLPLVAAVPPDHHHFDRGSRPRMQELDGSLRAIGDSKTMGWLCMLWIRHFRSLVGRGADGDITLPIHERIARARELCRW